MFLKTNVPLLGIVENMSYFISPSDGVRHAIFGTGGGAREAAHLEIPFLGEVPLEMALRASGDHGVPFLIDQKRTQAGEVLRKIAYSIKTKF
jgi:ATP-binding protein involved in chromosome partitioning